jgi:hypothetical protein
MLRILYWNILKKGDALLPELVILSKGIDILVIAELNPTDKNLKAKGITVQNVISNISNGTSFRYLGKNPKSWIHVWARTGIDIQLIDVYDELKAPRDITNKESADSEYFAEYLNRYERMQFYKVSYKKLKFLLVPIHFPSRKYATVDKQKDISVHFSVYIQKIEKKNNLKSVVLGDFNMNPFEPGMIHHEGFHALPTQQMKGSVEFYGYPYKTFYNPTWEKFGDYEIKNNKVKQRPSGSYFYDNSSDINYYWYLFDQVILRKELINYFSFKDFKIINGISNDNDLLNANLSPNSKDYSDHLPIKFNLKSR